MGTAVALLVFLSCGESATTPSPTSVPAPRPATVEVSPAVSELTAIGATVQLTARVRDQRQQLMTGVAVTWASDNPTTATVDAAGLVAAVGNGSATITATAGAVSGSGAVNVVQRVDTVWVSTPAATVVAGDTLRLTATAADVNGHTVDSAVFYWSSSDSTVAAVDSLGLVTGVRAGDAVISATADGVTGSTPLIVAPSVDAVQVSPASATIAPGDTVRLFATAFDRFGSALDSVEFDWSSSDSTVAAVDSLGLVTGERAGDAVISATADGVTGSTSLIVARSVDAVQVSPASATIAPGDTVRLVATAFDRSGSALDSLEFDWLSSDTSIAGVDETGLVRAIAEGTASITATADGVEGTSRIHVGDSDRAVLEAFFYATGGPQWKNSDGWLTAAPLETWYGVATDDADRVSSLVLRDNNLTGRLPRTVGLLTELRHLNLGRNDLEGPIPAELGHLRRLWYLWLPDNRIEGQLPPELGSLTELRELDLARNDLEGSLPVELGGLRRLVYLRLPDNRIGGRLPLELGSLTELQQLDLARNDLEGSLPTELGGLQRLVYLRLEDNRIVGRLPQEFGSLQALVWLDLTNNSGMSGTLPRELTNLLRLDRLLAGGTDLCAPTDLAFTTWLNSIRQRRVSRCASPEATAYLSQAVQSLEFPVPLISGEEALLRVFVTAARASSSRIPPVRAAFYLGGREVHVASIPQQEAFIPTAVDESSLSGSANALIPGDVLQPGLEMVVEIDPENTLDPGLGVASRIPEQGRMPLDVRGMPFFDLTVIPLLWRTRPDSAAVKHATGMAADPENHEMLWHTRTLLPVGELDVTFHEPVWSTANDGATLFRELEAIYAMEGATNYFLGMLSGEIGRGAIGLARPFGKVSFAIDDPEVVAHELGHNFGLGHTPCVNVRGDRNYPDPDGFIASWGYDFRDGGSLVSPEEYYDLMTYCDPKWISEYTFSRMVGYREASARSAAASRTAPTAPSLLLWGGADANGQPFLEPAFVVDAPPRLPESSGPHRLTGRSPDGVELFSLSFDMIKTADAAGTSAFAFTVPVEPQWADRLATVTVSGPRGAFTLDQASDTPITLLLDRHTGQVRGFLRDQLSEGLTRARAAELGAGRDLDVLFSRGIPAASAWRR